MGRIPPRKGAGLRYRFVQWYAKRRYGQELDIVAARAHHPGVLSATVRFETAATRWKSLDPTLQCLALQGTAALVGCPWCLDIGYWEAQHAGVDPVKIRSVAGWRTSEAFSELERLVLEYAEAITVTPPAVSDDLVARLRRRLGEMQFMELTALIALENQRSRTGMALGLRSQGFADHCAVPAAGSGRR